MTHIYYAKRVGDMDASEVLRLMLRLFNVGAWRVVRVYEERPKPLCYAVVIEDAA